MRDALKLQNQKCFQAMKDQIQTIWCHMAHFLDQLDHKMCSFDWVEGVVLAQIEYNVCRPEPTEK